MEKIKVRSQSKKNIYVHNDLSNAVFHFREQINERIKANDRKGIAFDMMACLVLLAFTFESKINFLGHKLIDEWKERQPFNKKIAQVFEILGLNPDQNIRPYSSINELKEFRDSIAHGKPIELEIDEESIIEPEEADKAIDLSAEWEAFCSQETVNRCSDDIDAVWKELLDKSGIELYETITSGSLGITFIEKIVDRET